MLFCIYDFFCQVFISNLSSIVAGARNEQEGKLRAALASESWFIAARKKNKQKLALLQPALSVSSTDSVS